MLQLDIKHWDKVVETIMPNKKDLYMPEDEQYGYCKTPHITILYGFLDGQNIDKQKLQQYLLQLDKIKPKIIGMSLFELQQYDVLKFDVQCKQCIEMNKAIRKDFKYSNDYDEYIPHVTIAYVKSGRGKQYIKHIKLFYPKVKQYIYNYKGEDIELIPFKLK